MTFNCLNLCKSAYNHIIFSSQKCYDPFMLLSSLKIYAKHKGTEVKKLLLLSFHSKLNSFMRIHRADNNLNFLFIFHSKAIKKQNFCFRNITKFSDFFSFIQFKSSDKSIKKHSFEATEIKKIGSSM